LSVLAGKVALVTGASRGIGAAIAEELGRNGATVVVNYLTGKQAAEDVVSRIVKLGGTARAVCCDVGDPEKVAEMIREALQAYGGLDVVVNNAGINRDRTLAKLSIDDWNAVMRTDLDGVMHVSAAALPHLVERGEGRIVNVASFVAQAGNFGQTNYAAAKAGVIGFTRSLALELAKRNVTVNAVCPGFIETAMWATMPETVRAKILERIPLGRVGRPEDVARAVRFLVTEGSYITGATLNVNGGIYIG